MLIIYENSKLYSVAESNGERLKHKEKIEVQLLILIQSKIGIQKELLEMLDKICAALKLNEENVEYVLLKGDCNLSSEVSFYGAKKVLCFGIEAKQLALNMELESYHLYNFNLFNLILAHSLLDVFENQNLKAKLWSELQKMFQ